MPPVSDLEIYQRLTAVAEEFDRMAAQAVSFAGGAALDTAARTLRGMASAVYEHSLDADPTELKPQ